MPPDPIARRRVRLVVVVAVSSAVVAAGATGAGLLLPSVDGGSLIRIGSAFAAVAAGGALLRIDGPTRAASSLTATAMAASLVCLATLPASPVTFPDIGEESTTEGEPPEGSVGQGDSGSERGGGGVTRRSDTHAIGLPPGVEVVVEDGQVYLNLVDGSRLAIGQATIGGVAPGVAEGGTTLTDADGVVTRADGGTIGGDVSLGGVTFERTDGSRVTVGDGRLYEVPPEIDSDGDRAEPLDAVLAVLLGVFALVAFAPPLVRMGERSAISLVDPPDELDEVEAEADMATMEEGLAEVLRSMLGDPDPRTSVIGAYARLLTAMAEAGLPRRDEEGPHEHLWRTLGPLGVRRQPLHRLAELFVRARFTPLPVTDEDRQAAIGALADAVGDLRLDASDVRTAVEEVTA